MAGMEDRDFLDSHFHGADVASLPPEGVSVTCTPTATGVHTFWTEVTYTHDGADTCAGDYAVVLVEPGPPGDLDGDGDVDLDDFVILKRGFGVGPAGDCDGDGDTDLDDFVILKNNFGT